MSKLRIYVLGLLTLIAFPALGIVVLWFFSDVSPWKILELNQIWKLNTIYGLLWGVAFSAGSLFLFNKPFFKDELSQQRRVLASLNLSVIDKLFLSFCAGFGEEILFRAGMQYYVGIWITTVFFIAIHGYLNPKKWRMSLYGIFLIPFIASLGYAYIHLGLWFAIAAHFSYDLVLFLQIRKEDIPVIAPYSNPEENDYQFEEEENEWEEQNHPENCDEEE